MEAKKKVLIYIPTATAKHDSKAVEGLYYLLSDCWARKADGYEFYLKIGTQMSLLDARNESVKFALRKGMDYMLWLDDDMVIPPDVWLFTQLMEHGKDIIAPLFFTRKGVKLPLVFKERKVNKKYAVLDHWVEYEKGLHEVDAVGFGCILINMDVFKSMKPPYFQYTSTLGEDIYFCMKARKAGYKIYCDTSITIGHIKPAEVSDESTYKLGEARKFLRRKKVKDNRDGATYKAKVFNKTVIDIVIPCYKNYELTKKAIEGLYRFTDNKRFKMVCINDGADPKLHKYFNRLAEDKDNFKFIETEEAAGCVKGINRAVKECSGDFVLVCDNDTQVQDPEWLPKMLGAFDRKTAIVVPVSNYAFGVQSIRYNELFRTKGILRHNVELISGYFELIRRKALDGVGGWDEDFGLGYNVDLDLSIKMTQAGYTMKVIRDLFVYHHGSKSISQVADIKKLDKDSRKFLEKKWGKDKIEGLITKYKESFKNG